MSSFQAPLVGKVDWQLAYTYPNL